MWTRSLLKTNAKQVLSRNYWIALLVCLVTSLLWGSSGGANPVLSFHYTTDSGHYNSHFQYNGLYFLKMFTALFAGFIVVIALLGIVLSIFVGGPIAVGKCRYFMESRVGNAPFSTLFSTFGGPAYWNVVKVMLLKRVFIFLWSLLFVIPGIYKAYQYSMVDYLLAENPYLTLDRALALSRAMTDGEKFNMFLLDLSFFGWLFFGSLIVIGVFFVNPYIEATYGELYAALRAKIFALQITDERELSGFMRY